MKLPKRRRPKSVTSANGLPSDNRLPSDAELAGWLKVDRPPSVFRQSAHRLAEVNRPIAALHVLDRLIGLQRAIASDWKLTGQLLCQVGEFAQGLDALRQSVEQDPTDPEAWHDLGRASYKLGRTDRAFEELTQAAKLSTDLSPLLALATMAPGAESVSQEAILHCRRSFASKLVDVDPPIETTPATLPTTDQEKVRLGFLSSWFEKENYMKPVWALINHLNRDRFEVHFFDDSDSKKGDGIAGYRFDGRDVWHETSSLSNADLASLIATIQVHIAIDLNAYSTPHRLGLFTKRFAGVQAAWFNMYATSGLPEIDYIIGDQMAVDLKEAKYYSETIALLDQSYLTFEVTHQTPPVVEPPCLKTGSITFGSLVTFYKITPNVIRTWAEILKQTPGAKLALGNTELKSKHNGQFLQDCFRAEGIEAYRLVLLGPAPHAAFLRYYDQFDIALDAFPYNGGTTTMEAIWQGVPVIAFRGDRWASRTSASLLTGTPFERFVASDREGYIKRAVELANSPQRGAILGDLRRTAREQLRACSVCDGAGLANSIQALFEDWIKQNAIAIDKSTLS
ncbi:tetratricopeptide repeat protein [Rhodopirellula sp. MGV]|uniref:O-linked N-acetylglucosamine transferase, SPINDLY family protein n=1 Tax=Rhodopirellula sp. MGV TaxID=2023130 RepID=UPI000B96BBE5|nr:tetratricopeptide repeat protein [Rhodopirellula sp. MGV]OYP29954.1 hypothetical protein CGZ80_23305 [Rhodopirellula sp. MGV]PNY33410.1 hypothetical protein C2E31_28320 [Rhodopirellula baltica]